VAMAKMFGCNTLFHTGREERKSNPKRITANKSGLKITSYTISDKLKIPIVTDSGEKIANAKSEDSVLTSNEDFIYNYAQGEIINISGMGSYYTVETIDEDEIVIATKKIMFIFMTEMKSDQLLAVLKDLSKEINGENDQGVSFYVRFISLANVSVNSTKLIDSIIIDSRVDVYTCTINEMMINPSRHSLCPKEIVFTKEIRKINNNKTNFPKMNRDDKWLTSVSSGDRKVIAAKDCELGTGTSIYWVTGFGNLST